ncbi:MAG: toxin-antitoxin system YwqK family antitoxin [Bacteroidetes bacterium]|nr:toxin-antitoxin system YwqK family antitoxin [Bacteroidota bacterium]MBU1719714.1 toxin-antitoxin system YwqK family antitoxin [Bacteroidota bacterium]
MKRSVLLSFAMLLVSAFIYSQDNTFMPTVVNDTTTNKVDEKGRKQGVWKKFHETGEVKYCGKFVDDVPVDTFKYYYPDGKLMNTLAYEPGGKIAHSINYFEDGKTVMAEGDYLEKEKNGKWQYFTETGDIVREENYLKGLPEGQWKNFYPGSGMSNLVTYKNGKKDGPWNEYFQNGKVKFAGTYVGDSLHGEFTIYYPSGFKKKRGQYINNYKEGVWTVWNSDGSVKGPIKYVKGIEQLTEEEKAKRAEELKKQIGTKLPEDILDPKFDH